MQWAVWDCGDVSVAVFSIFVSCFVAVSHRLIEDEHHQTVFVVFAWESVGIATL